MFPPTHWTAAKASCFHLKCPWDHCTTSKVPPWLKQGCACPHRLGSCLCHPPSSVCCLSHLCSVQGRDNWHGEKSKHLFVEKCHLVVRMSSGSFTVNAEQVTGKVDGSFSLCFPVNSMSTFQGKGKDELQSVLKYYTCYLNNQFYENVKIFSRVKST